MAEIRVGVSIDKTERCFHLDFIYLASPTFFSLQLKPKRGRTKHSNGPHASRYLDTAELDCTQQRSHVVSSTPCLGGWTPALLSAHLSTESVCTPAQIKTTICTRRTTAHQFI